MKVIGKRKDKQSAVFNIILSLIIISIFIAISFAIYVLIFKTVGVKEGLDQYGMLIPSGLMFLLIALVLLFNFFKKPVRYTAELVSVEKNVIKGENITEMYFKILAEDEEKETAIPREYMCYVKGEAKLTKGHLYNIYIKQLTELVKYVDEEPVRSNDRTIKKLGVYSYYGWALIVVGGIEGTLFIGLIKVIQAGSFIGTSLILFFMFMVIITTFFSKKKRK